MGLICPAFADVFIGRETLEGFEPFGEVVGRDEVGEVFAQLVVVLVVEAFDGCFLDRPVHPLDLAVGPGVLGLSGSVIDVVSGACQFEGMGTEAFAVGDSLLDQRYCRSTTARGGKMDAIVGQYGVDLVGHGLDQAEQKVARCRGLGLLVQFDKGELAGPVDRHEHVELALFGAYLGEVDVEVSNRV